MNKTNRVMGIYLTTLIIFILTAVSLRSVALFIDFNQLTNNFDDKSVIIAASICAAVGCIFLFTYVIVAPKDKKLIADFSSPATYVPTGAICTSLAIFSIYGCKTLAQTNLPITVLLKPSISARFIFTVCVILSMLSIIHFALTALVTKRGSTSRAAFGIIAVLFFALYASFLYFDTTLAINAPNKIVDQMAFLFTAIFFLYETRISLEREVWHLYIAFGFIAAVLNAYSSIPSIIIYFVKGITVSNNIFENVVSFCVFLFILSRIILASRLKEDKESEIVTLMKEYSLQRDCDTEQSNEYIYNKYIDLNVPVVEEAENPDSSKDNDEDLIINDGGNGEEDIIEILAEADNKSENAATSSNEGVAQEKEESVFEDNTNGEMPAQQENVTDQPHQNPDGQDN